MDDINQNSSFSPSYIHTDTQKKMRLLLTVGRILMENGSHTTYTVQQMIKAAAFVGIAEEKIAIHISYATITINICDENFSHTALMKITSHKINMATIDALSKALWNALEGFYTLDELSKKLTAIETSPSHYSTSLISIAGAFACGAFAILFGGNFLSALASSLAALLGYITKIIYQKKELNEYLIIILAAFTSMSCAYLFYLYFNEYSMLYAMISCTLFLIPGIPLINSVVDAINNYFISGLTRLLHTIMIIGAMTLGIVMALHFNVTPIFEHLDTTAHYITMEQTIAAFFASSLFAILFNLSSKLLPYIGVGGIICVSIKNYLVVFFHFAMPAAAFIGAAIVSILMVQLASHLRTSSTSMTIPSVIPLIPGVLLYRFLFDIIHIASLDTEALLFTFQNGITGFLTVVAISVGVAIPNVLVQKQKNRTRKKYIAHLLSRSH